MLVLYKTTRVQYNNTVSPCLSLPGWSPCLLMRNVWRRMRNRLSQAVVSTCTTLVPTSRPFVCAASHASSRHRLCNSLQQLRTRPTRPPFRGHPVFGAFTRQITADFSPRTVSVRSCIRNVAARFAMYSCPANLLLPFCCDDELTNLPDSASRNRTLFPSVVHLRAKALPTQNAHAICAHMRLYVLSNGACTSRP